MFEMPNSLSQKTLRTMRENYIKKENKKYERLFVGDYEILVDNINNTYELINISKEPQTQDVLYLGNQSYKYQVGEIVSLLTENKEINYIIKSIDHENDGRTVLELPYAPKNRKEKRDLKFKRKII